MRSMAPSPNAALVEALGRRDLAEAEEVARDLDRVDPEHSLAIVLLMVNEHDVRWERAAVRWAGTWLAAHPSIGIEHATELLRCIGELDGSSPDLARSQVAMVLRMAGGGGPASVLERW